jgi:hypothetical protein
MFRPFIGHHQVNNIIYQMPLILLEDFNLKFNWAYFGVIFSFYMLC